MGRIVGSVLLLVLVIFGLMFAVLNNETVGINYYFGSFQVPLSLALVLTLTCGALLGVIASLGVVLRLRRDNSRLHKAVAIKDRELKNLRALPIKSGD